jgi:hypothetical protein
MKSPMTNFAGLGSRGVLIPIIHRRLRPGGKKPGGWDAIKLEFRDFGLQSLRDFKLSSFQAFRPASILIQRFGLFNEHNRDVIPNLVN